MKRILIVLTLFLLSACGSEMQNPANQKMQEATIQPLASTSINTAKAEATSQSNQPTMLQGPEQKGVTPTHIRIPAINVDAPIVEKGLNNMGEMEVPNNGTEVGWFEPGTKPGDSGNSILAGHVDDKDGPAVFFHLKDLEAGDLIYVTGQDGEERTFEVNDVVAYPKDEAPLWEIFGPANEQNLNLLTCTGTFDHAIQDHEERLVVYTSLKP